MQPLLLWNNTPYAQYLAGVFGKEYVIADYEALENATQDWDKFNSLIVLCELNWSGNSSVATLQSLQGIELIKNLRLTKDLTLPVLFVSFVPLAEIIKNAEKEITTTIGHDFCQLPASPNDFISLIENEFLDAGNPKKLSVIELNDIKSFYCSKEGILSHELHYLNRYLNLDINELNHKSVYGELTNSIKKIHALFLKDAAVEIDLFHSQFPELNKTNISEAVNYIIRIGNSLRNKYGLKPLEQPDNPSTRELYKWKILLLDDEIGNEHSLIKCMRANNLDVVCCDNAVTAFDILKRDWAGANAIMVVIADYRLYEYRNGVRRHQKIQGYKFLKEITTSDHLVRLVAFSGLQRRFLLNSFRHYNIRTEVKSKIDYLADDHTNQLFCDEIIEMAEENWEAIEALPVKCAGFEKSLLSPYKEFRMHPDYNKMEGNVSLTAKEYVREIQQQIIDGDQIGIGAIDYIKSPMAKTKKDQEAYFIRFQNYLVARRIALWLYASNKRDSSLDIDSRRIAEILTGQKYPTDAYRQVLSTNLGLSLDDFPKNITIEERRWLQYEMQMSIFRDINFINPVFNKISFIFKEFITSHTKLSQKITSSKYQLSNKYKQGIYSLNFDRQLAPVLKTQTDVRVLFLILKEHFEESLNKIDVLKPLVSKIRYELIKGAKEVTYLKNLFEYFNAIYRQMNNEKSVIINPSQKITAKSEFQNKSATAINNVFEKVYVMLQSGEIPSANETADVFSVYACGMDIAEELSPLNEHNKATFFSKLIQQINMLNVSYTKSYDESRKSKQNSVSDDDAFDEIYTTVGEDIIIEMPDDFAFD